MKEASGRVGHTKPGRAKSGRARPGHDGSWSPAPSALAVPSGHVDVWKVCLDEPAKAVSEPGVLSPDEITRAGRFHFEPDRIHFTRCRSALRALLARYLAIPAGEICFECLANGKPQVTVGQNPRLLQFNVSHSAGLALIAVGSEHRLGVDIEKIRSEVDTAALAERFFSVHERDGLRALPNHLRTPGFYACWTRKESFLKATGEGLSFPLADFSVTTDPGRDPELEDLNGSAQAGKRWFLADLTVADGYRATVAVETTPTHLKTYLY